MSNTFNTKTVVEILDREAMVNTVAPHVANRVLVNGSPVRVDPDPGGIDIDFGPNDATVVTLRLLVDELTFHH